jgi:predicted Zn-dependent protease
LLAVLIAVQAVSASAQVMSSQNLPALGDTESEELSPAAERRIGEYIMRAYRSNGLVYEDRETAEYLQQLGAKVVSTSPGAAGLDFEFFLVNDFSLNAFAMPGGFIGVHSGLIFAARSESELASVLAHEVGHVTQRHIARSFSRQKQTSLLAMAALALAVLASRGGGQAATGVFAAGNTLATAQQLGFSRDAEREADRVGFQALVNAGFEPQGMVAFFERLQQGSRLYEGNAPAYLRTHPVTSERITDIRNRVGRPATRMRADSAEFQFVRAKMRTLKDSSVDGLKSALVFFSQDAATVGLTNPAALEYGRALIYIRQNDWLKAESSLKKLRSLVSGESVFIERLALDLSIGQLIALAGKGGLEIADNRAKMASLAEQAVVLRNKYPGKTSLSILAIDTLQRAGEHNKAIQLLREDMQVFSTDIELYDRLAESQFAIGRRAEHHMTLSKSYELRGAFSAALEQIQLAQRYGSGDFYLQSQIDVRRKFLEEKVLEARRNEGRL